MFICADTSRHDFHAGERAKQELFPSENKQKKLNRMRWYVADDMSCFLINQWFQSDDLILISPPLLHQQQVTIIKQFRLTQNVGGRCRRAALPLPFCEPRKCLKFAFLILLRLSTQKKVVTRSVEKNHDTMYAHTCTTHSRREEKKKKTTHTQHTRQLTHPGL
jgi:hypothetical protein